MDKKIVGGALSAFSAYLMWGFLPLYWKLFYDVPSFVIMSHRIVWAFVFSFMALAVSGRLSEFKAAFSSGRRIMVIVLRGILLAINWTIFIWGIGHGHVLESSLGYYINPLVSVSLGLIFLKERLNTLQKVAVGFAIAGVGVKTVLVGQFPVIAVSLALSFGLYGLLKKRSSESAVTGVALECMVIFPIALAYMIYSEIAGFGGFMPAGVGMKILYSLAGVVTVVPLVLFSAGSKRIPLFGIGFLQFIAPTLMMIIGLVLYGEVMKPFDLAGFVIVWIGVVIFMFSFKRVPEKRNN